MNAAGFGTGHYQIEIKIDDLNGKKIGEGSLDNQKNNVQIKIQPIQDGKLRDIYILFHSVNVPEDKKPLLKQLQLSM